MTRMVVWFENRRCQFLKMQCIYEQTRQREAEQEAQKARAG